MKNYEVKVKYGFDQTANQYCVLERKTQYILKQFDQSQPAFKLCKHLNRGGGFNGNTPTFVARQPKTGELRSWIQ